LHHQAESKVESAVVSSVDLKHSVIELADLTSNPEAEISKLKSTMSAMAAEIGHIRGENVKLIADYQKLTTEFREIKLVLAKVHAKELRAVEGRSSWLESLDLQGMFKKNQD
jgi:hypothetical protein